ncbi:MAG TPA: sigma factor-like helix-turn-helix DNA-binding protein, partial [Thermomonas sp.]|nr:sigma factor-like helix-turn-helix DNA-binding protein [Thermomonas sp.]
TMRLRHDAVPLDADLHEITGADTRDHEHQHHLLQLQRCIQQQAPLDRALLLLYLDERPQREIADILGISESNVSTKIGRLKQRIQQTL